MERQGYRLAVVMTVVTVVGGLSATLGLATTCEDFQLSGAIFTTNQLGVPVNMNIYTNKNQVYLDGGPGPDAPAGAAALPAGDYYFQVTDPAGKVLLSTDAVTRRRFTVSQDGVIVLASDHKTSPDADYGEQYNAVVVQLMPFDNTPNNGGVYKVWVTPVDCYSVGAGNFGFVPRFSKTDNFKVKGKVDQFLRVKKFKDCDGDGVWDSNEPEIPGAPGEEGWPITVVEPDGVTTQEHTTPFCILAYNGCWTVNEEDRWDGCKGWKPTALIIDGQTQTPGLLATVCFTSPQGLTEETHTVIFGNQPLSSIKVCKFYDCDGDGRKDAGEGPVAGIKFLLRWGDRSGPVIDTQYTGTGGCASFCGLTAGSYTVEEVLPSTCNWAATTPRIVENITVGACQDPVEITREFGNVVTGTACFSTKGYWHNKNGLAELTEADRSYVNGLDPYKAPSSYFEAGDEPFDGRFQNSDPVAAAFNNDDNSLIWGAGTWQAEISHFLVDNNSDGGQREQLAQQLLAFLFNVRHRLPSAGAAIELPGGGWIPASVLIQNAITAWNTGTDAGAMASLLDTLNSRECSPGVVYILDEPGDCVPTTQY